MYSFCAHEQLTVEYKRNQPDRKNHNRRDTIWRSKITRLNKSRNHVTNDDRGRNGQHNGKQKRERRIEFQIVRILNVVVAIDFLSTQFRGRPP